VPVTDGQKMSKSYGNTIESLLRKKPFAKNHGLVMAACIAGRPKPDAEKNLAGNVSSGWHRRRCPRFLGAGGRAGGLGYGDP